MERELIGLLWPAGFACIRSAGSGRTRHPNPDILASNGRKVYAIECKSSAQDEIRFEKSQLDGLVSFSTLFNARPVIAARFNHNDWLFLTPERLERTDSGNVKIGLDYAKANGSPFSVFFRD